MKKTIILLSIIFIIVLHSCNENNKNVDLGQVIQEIESTCPSENMMALTSNELMPYYGIDKEDVVQSEIRINSTGIKADEIVIIEAKDSDAAIKIEKKLNQRLKEKANQAKNYSPHEYTVITNSKVERAGNYITMFVSEQSDKMADIFNNYFN